MNHCSDVPGKASMSLTEIQGDNLGYSRFRSSLVLAGSILALVKVHILLNNLGYCSRCRAPARPGSMLPELRAMRLCHICKFHLY